VVLLLHLVLIIFQNLLEWADLLHHLEWEDLLHHLAWADLLHHPEWADQLCLLEFLKFQVVCKCLKLEFLFNQF
jgi:hypothetical protein